MSSETCFILDIAQHKKKNLPTVVTFLRSRSIRGVGVFTEASNTELKRTHPFYGKLSNFLLKQKAIEMHEPDYEASMQQARELYEASISPVLRQLRSSSFGWQPETRIAEFNRFMQIVCDVRDPIIAKQIIDHTPRYAIFGPGHIPGVLARLKDQPSINIEVLKLISSPKSAVARGTH